MSSIFVKKSIRRDPDTGRPGHFFQSSFFKMRVGLMSCQREKQGPLHVTAGVKKDGETLPPGNGSQCINSCSTIKRKEITDLLVGHVISPHNYAAIVDPRL
jgi:hypothetical protein